MEGITMYNIYEMTAIYDRRKSFYGKAYIIEFMGRKILLSYDTRVCEIDASGKFHRYWGGESVTTMRHINEFIRQNGISGGGVAWWREQHIEEEAEMI
jgi:hypothetical protein